MVGPNFCLVVYICANGARVPEDCGLWSPPSRLRSGSPAAPVPAGRRRPGCVPESRTAGAGREMTSQDVTNSFSGSVGSPPASLLLKPAHLGEAGLVAVFDHADEVGGSGRHKLGPERPHDRI